MRTLFRVAASLTGILAIGCATPLSSTSAFPDPLIDLPAPTTPAPRTAVVAGGCFWGVEAVFERLAGVTGAVSGYAGGTAATAHYDAVSEGTTGHAESVRITYDPARVSYGQLLKVFFAVAHDPTELNRQGPDHGTQYRSAIFYTSADEKRVAEAYIRQLDDAKVFRTRIVTALAPLDGFYPAEPYHQDFVAHNPGYPYVVYNDLPKVRRLEQLFPAMLKTGR